jgi:hypothetical protein
VNYAKALSMLAFLLLPLAAACASPATTATSTPPPQIEHFPVQLEQAATVLTARFEGVLGIRDGYLAMNGDKVILWPYGFTLDTSGSVPRVLDGEGNEVARYGEKLVLGGGFIPTYWAEEKVGLDLPDWPDETCWLTGSVVPPTE